ncbi:hypothetical protein PF010_g21106, partial [Phytophthora fragariae]
SPHLTFSRL